MSIILEKKASMSEKEFSLWLDEVTKPIIDELVRREKLRNDDEPATSISYEEAKAIWEPYLGNAKKKRKADDHKEIIESIRRGYEKLIKERAKREKEEEELL